MRDIEEIHYSPLPMGALVRQNYTTKTFSIDLSKGLTSILDNRITIDGTSVGHKNIEHFHSLLDQFLANLLGDHLAKKD